MEIEQVNWLKYTSSHINNGYFYPDTFSTKGSTEERSIVEDCVTEAWVGN